MRITKIIDYKTSKTDAITDEYYRQLSIYSLMHETELNSTPHKAGILFLKFDQNPVMLDVDKKMIEGAKKVCSAIKESTKSNKIEDYPRFESGLCKWQNGQCDFYEICMG